MNLHVLEEEGIDCQEGLNRFFNDSDLYESVLHAFIERNVINEIQDAYANNDVKSLYAFIHEIKGSSGNASLQCLFEKACTFSDLLKDENYSIDKYNELYSDFTKEYIKIITVINKAFTS